MASEWNEAYRKALQENQGGEKFLEAMRKAEAAIEARHRTRFAVPTQANYSRFGHARAERATGRTRIEATDAKRSDNPVQSSRRGVRNPFGN